jgi:hypothetical protein
MHGDRTTYIATHYLLHHQKSSNDANNHFQKYHKFQIVENIIVGKKIFDEIGKSSCVSVMHRTRESNL